MQMLKQQPKNAKSPIQTQKHFWEEVCKDELCLGIWTMFKLNPSHARKNGMKSSSFFKQNLLLTDILNLEELSNGTDSVLTNFQHSWNLSVKTGCEAGMDEERQVKLIKSLADNEQIAAICGQNAKTVTEIIQAIQDMKIHAQNVKKTESPAFMKINDEVVNKKLEEQTTKLHEVITMLAKLSLSDRDDTAQAYHDQNNGPLWQKDSGSYQNHRGAPYKGNSRGGFHAGYRGNSWRGRNNGYISQWIQWRT